MEFTDEMLSRIVVPGKGMPVYLDERPPEINDPSTDTAEHHWIPACKGTERLVRCLEGIRDVAAGVFPLSASPNPDRERRLLKQLVTPIYTLAIALRDLYNFVQANCWKRIDRKEQRRLRDVFASFTKTVPTDKGVLKTARDKIGAHLDKDLHTNQYKQLWDSFGIEQVMSWIRGCMKMLVALLGPDIYSWTRSSGYSNVVNLMNVDGHELSLLMKDSRPDCIVGFIITRSPKYGVDREVYDLHLACSAICKRLGINEGTVWRVPTGQVPAQ
jgi:hypothetical protein